MKNYSWFCLFFIMSCPAWSQDTTDSIFAELHNTIKNKEIYVRQKELTIAHFKNKLLTGNHTVRQEYQLNKRLYLEYKKFRLDSAIAYALKNIALAHLLQDQNSDQEARIQLADLYSSSGKYRESEIILRHINSRTLAKELLLDYYEAYDQFFEHYATNSYNPEYIQQVALYRDSLLSVLSPSSIKYAIYLAQKNIYQGKTDSALKSMLAFMKAAK